MPNKPIYRLPPYTVQHVATSLAETQDWGHKLFGVSEAWQQTRGAGVTVAVLDTGCDFDHPDLRGRVTSYRDFTRSVSGPRDMQGHGTHCAGVIGASQNDVGVVGVAPQCSLLIGKVLGDDGSGTTDDIAEGIDWATNLGADVISMSLGAPTGTEDIRQALIRAVKAGKFIICAAGNDGRPNSVGYPAAWDDLAVAVGAIGRDGKLANFSSRGRQVDVCGPGVDVLSCWPGGRYARLSGTSMATPFVAGVVALLVARHRDLGGGATPLTNQAELLEHLTRTAIDAGAPGFDQGYGFGLVNPKKLLEEAAKNAPQPEVLVFGPFDALGHRWTVRGEPLGAA